MQRTIALLAVGFVLALAPGPLQAQTPSQQLEELLVQGADTPAEHKALAAYYRDKAAEAREHAKHHRTMAHRYEQLAAFKGRGQAKHCETLVTLNEQAAAEYDALAKGEDAAASN